jgi:hypothetical protein
MSIQLPSLAGGASTYPRVQHTLSTPGLVQSIYLTLHPDALEEIAQKIEGWFADRPEVQIVDVGTSDKVGLGFLLIEWIECAIDPLFLAILRDEASVGDYTLYGRSL